MGSDRELAPLSRDQCLRLVDSVPFGRIVFTSRAMPGVRLVSHTRLGDQIAIPASRDLGVTADELGTVVAYEADLIGPDQRPAWTVLVIGRARRVTVPELTPAQRERLSSWPGDAPDEVIMIRADLVTGEQMHSDPAIPRTSLFPGLSEHHPGAACRQRPATVGPLSFTFRTMRSSRT